MNVSADQIRAATRMAAEVITADQVPSLELPDDSHGRHRPARRTWLGSLVPLVAAAAVAIVVVGSAAVGSSLARSGNGNGQPGGPSSPATSASPFSGVPPYYVAVESPLLAVVRSTATGAILARITSRTPFVGVAGTVDGRTFVLDEQRQVMGPMVTWLRPAEFYVLRLGASGFVQSYTRLPIGPLPKKTPVTGLALSPDGSKLAIEMDYETNDVAHMQEIKVYTLATLAVRTWSVRWSDDPVDPNGFTGSGVDASESISWAGDSRMLAFDWSTDQAHVGVRILDTQASGDNLRLDSRLAIIESDLTAPGGPRPGPPALSKDHISQCGGNSIISLDGSAIVCAYGTNMNDQQTTTGFLSYSTRTGQLTAALGVTTFRGQAPGDISLYWVNSTGTILIGAVLTPGGARVGVINGEKFTPLPGITSLGAAAW